MADSDTPSPEPSDLDFDLDFDLGEIDFEEPAQKAPASEDVLSRDLESLLRSEASAPAPTPEPAPEPIPEPIPEPVATPPEVLPEDELEDLEDVDLDDDADLVVAELDDIEATIPEAGPTAEADPEPIAEFEEDEIEVEFDDDEFEVELDEPASVEVEEEPLADELEEEDELEAVFDDEPVESEAAPKVEEEPETIELESVDAIDIDEDSSAISDAAQAAALRRRERRRPAPEKVPLGTDEFEVVFEDDAADDLVGSTMDDLDAEIEPAFDDDDIDDIEPALEDETDDFEAALPELEAPAAPDLDDEIASELDDIEELTSDLEPEPPKKASFIPRGVSAVVAENEIDDLDGIDDLPESTLPPAAVETVADFEDDELEVAFDDDELDDLPIEPAEAEITAAPAIDELDDLEEIEDVSSEFEDELEVAFDDDDLSDLPASPAAASAADDEFDSDDDFAAPEEDVQGADEAVEDQDVDEFDAAIDDAPDSDGESTKGSFFKFKPLELAGLAAVFVVCLGGLFMLVSNVSGVLSQSDSDGPEISKRTPSKLDGDILKIDEIDCFWRNRTSKDRVKEPTEILPVVTLSAPSGSGQIQILFKDSQGSTRGDGTVFRISGGAFEGGAKSVTAICTEGLANEAQYSYYRSDSDLALEDRWNVTIRESTDGLTWNELARFEIPAKRNKE